MKPIEFQDPRYRRPERETVNGGTSGEGFVLLESLIALAMVSILSIGSLTLIQNVSRTFGDLKSGELTPLTNTLSNNPDAYSTRGRLRLESVRNLETGAVWRVYRYRTDGGQIVEFPVYEPPGN